MESYGVKEEPKHEDCRWDSPSGGSCNCPSCTNARNLARTTRIAEWVDQAFEKKDQ